MSHPIGPTLPQAFLDQVHRNPSAETYFSKSATGWQNRTYRDLYQYIRRVIAGLKKLDFKLGETICILAENRMEWTTTDYAAQWLGGITTAIYTTSTFEQIDYILRESQTKVLFVSNPQLLARCRDLNDLPSLKAIVLWDGDFSDFSKGSFSLLCQSEFLQDEISEKEAEDRVRSIDPKSLSCILYTSGTTGEPKGVMLTQENFVSNINQIRDVVAIDSGKVTISFLPLSHIYERIIHQYMLLMGLRIYFAESVDRLLDNIQEVRPHVMTAVPRIFEKMYSKIMDRVKNAPFARRVLFYKALEIGKATAHYRLQGRPLPFLLRPLSALADILVFRKIRAITGGRAEIFVSGGAPLSREIAEFFYNAGFIIIEGYGLSETCILSVNHPHRIKFGTVGFPFRDTQVKIDVDGEILIRGPQVSQGYFRRPDATAEAIDADGWFHTGDIGEYGSDGFLKITDRKKELIVTAGGKKIAPQPIENALKRDPLVESVCLIGDKRRFISALIVPNLEFCKSWSSHRNESVLAGLDAYAAHPPLIDHFQRLINTMNESLPKFSTIKKFRILSHPFSIDSGELTPTLKLKRRIIQEKYQTLIDELYRDEIAA